MLPRASVVDLRELVAGHRHARRVRAVRGVGDDDRVALLALAAVGEVRAHQHQPGQLALRAGRRLQRDRVEAGDLGEDLLQPPHQLERALRAVLLLVRVQVAEAGQRDDALVDARVVLHRAGAERVEARVDPEVARRELGEVADELGLGELGQPRRLARGAAPSGTSTAGRPRSAAARAGAAARAATSRRSASSPHDLREHLGEPVDVRRRALLGDARRAARRRAPRSRGRARSRGGRRARAASRDRPRARGRPTRTANSLNVGRSGNASWQPEPLLRVARRAPCRSPPPRGAPAGRARTR